MPKHTQTLTGLGLCLALSAACTPLSTTPTPPAATPLPSTQPSMTPEPTPTVSPAPTPTATPEPSTHTPEPTPTPTLPPPEPTPEPTPSLPTLSSVTVRVRDEDDRQVNAVQISIRSLNPNTPYTKTYILEQNDNHNFDDLPLGILLEFSVTAPGYNQQVYSLVTTSSPQELIFSGDTTGISSRPEVIQVEPGFPAQLNVFDPITLHFSESINHQSLQDSIALQLQSDTQSAFSVGTLIPRPLSLLGRASDSIYDSNHFRFDWHTDRKVTITPLYGWPVARNNSFRITLNYLDGGSASGGIKDRSGLVARAPVEGSQSDEDGKTQRFEDGPFRIGNTYRAYLPITLRHNDIPRTEISRVIASNGNNDEILLRFNQSLSFNLTTGDPVVGGADGVAGSAPAGGSAGVTAQDAAQNYNLICNDNPVSWPAGTAAIFVNPDEIRLIAPTGENFFDPGDACTISNHSFRDIFGRTVPTDTRNFRVN